KATKKQQSQFLKWFQPILDALKQLGGSGKPREVSDKIAQNLVYDHFRKVASDRRMIQELSNHTCELYWHSDVLIEEKEQNDILCCAIESLSPQRKKTFVYCKLEGYSYQKASEVLGISQATINTHITHSFRLLKSYVLRNYC
ncbi:MAG: RNA polymerase sigma factor, partial [Pedobacter sp.]